jgi:hypothetical protein
MASGIDRMDSDSSVALLYIAEVLARRLDGANRALIELKNQLQAGQPRDVIKKTAEKVEDMLGVGGASLVYAGYPYESLRIASQRGVQRMAGAHPYKALAEHPSEMVGSRCTKCVANATVFPKSSLISF